MSPDKEIALHAYVQSEIGKPFKYGKHDCVSFVAKALDIVTGGDMAETIEERRSTHNKLDEYIAEYGSIKRHYIQAGCKRVDMAFASTGDFVVRDGATSGVCLGAKLAINTDDNGVTLIPLSLLTGENIAMRFTNG